MAQTPSARVDGARVDALRVSAYRFPTDAPEADGTLRWDATTLVVVEVEGGGESGLGYSYAHRAAAEVVDGLYKQLVVGSRLFDRAATWELLRERSRNIGRPGVASMAISAVDTALWDLEARVVGLPLATLLGPLRRSVPVYGSGGFTSYSDTRLVEQLAGWVGDGIPRVKMKVGEDPSRDLQRVRAVREAIGSGPELFVDANGAYGRKPALAFARDFAALGVTWFEEPVSMDDRDGLRLIRDRAPEGMEVAAGEYGFDLGEFAALARAGAVDVLQADVTRCQGITGFLRVSALCEAEQIPLSTHCAPALHLHVACAAPRLRHMEWFHDHVRIEAMAFDGSRLPAAGLLSPDFSAPGHGLALKRADIEKYRL